MVSTYSQLVPIIIIVSSTLCLSFCNATLYMQLIVPMSVFQSKDNECNLSPSPSPSLCSKWWLKL